MLTHILLFLERYDAHVLDDERSRPNRQTIYGGVKIG